LLPEVIGAVEEHHVGVQPVISSSIFIHRRVLDKHASSSIRNGVTGRHGVDRGDGAAQVEDGGLASLYFLVHRHRRKHEPKPTRAVSGSLLWKWLLPGSGVQVPRCLQCHRLRCFAWRLLAEAVHLLDLYLTQPNERVDFHVSKPTTIWWRATDAERSLFGHVTPPRPVTSR